MSTERSAFIARAHPNSPPDDRVLELALINVPRSTSSANVLEIEPLRCPDLEIGVIDR
jgi:hypothetical protein